MRQTTRIFLRTEITTFLLKKGIFKKEKPPTAMVLAHEMVVLLQRLEGLGYIKIKRFRKRLHLHQKKYEFCKPAWQSKDE